jgi:hypothetical protein
MLVPSPGESNLGREVSSASSRNGIFEQWPKRSFWKADFSMSYPARDETVGSEDNFRVAGYRSG